MTNEIRLNASLEHYEYVHKDDNGIVDRGIFDAETLSEAKSKIAGFCFYEGEWSEKGSSWLKTSDLFDNDKVELHKIYSPVHECSRNKAYETLVKLGFVFIANKQFLDYKFENAIGYRILAPSGYWIGDFRHLGRAINESNKYLQERNA